MRRFLALAASLVLSVVSATIGPSHLSAAAPDVVSGDVAQTIDTYLTRLTPFGWSGVVLVAKDDQIILSKGYGLADREAKRAWSPDTVGNIGSITKQFTAAAILKLESLGKLSVQDAISKYLPGVPADKEAVTLHMLLTHTSGLSGDLGGADDDPIARDALVKLVLASKLSHRPGETFEYSNEGFSLLAAVVERVSGVSYERFLHDQLFTPAGMTKTGYLLAPYRDEELAVGYRADGTKWGLVYKRNWRSDGPGWYLAGNGGIQSTIGDLFKWHLALEGDAVLPAAERTKLFTPVAPTPGGGRYAYGWGVTKTPRGTTVIAHNGGNGFYSADFRRYVDDHIVIITMGNAPVIAAAAIGVERIDPLTFNPASVTLPPATVTLSSKVIAQVAGDYTTMPGNGRLHLAATPTGIRAESTDPTLLALLAGFTPPGGRYASLEEKTSALVTASAKADFQPIVDAFVGARTLAQVQAGQGAEWKQWTTDFGPFKRFDLLGVRLNEGDPVVVVRLTFDHGSAIAQYAWGPRRLAGFIAGLDAPSREFVAASPTSFVTFDYRTGATVRIDLDEAKRTATVSGGGVTVKAEGR